MPAGKVYVNASTPASWGADLQHGEIWFDPVHAELIGEDTSEEYQAKLASMNISGDEPNIDPQMWREVEPYEHAKQLVGDDEEAPPDDDGAPGADEPPPVEMGPESDTPGGNVAPTYDRPSGPTGSARARFQGRRGPPRAAPNSIAKFQANIRAKNPQAIRALLLLQKKARQNPGKYGNLFSSIASPFMRRGSLAIRGEPVVVGALTSLIKVVLSPVAWTAHGVGTVSHEVGKTLTKLAGKL